MLSHKRVAEMFGKTLRGAREKAGISQEDLGKRASLHRTEIGLLERGARVPRIDTLVKLASALSVKPAALLAGIEWRPESLGRERFDFPYLDDASEQRNATNVE